MSPVGSNVQLGTGSTHADFGLIVGPQGDDYRGQFRATALRVRISALAAVYIKARCRPSRRGAVGLKDDGA